MEINKNYFIKNKLDLEYHKNTQLLGGIIIFATTGLLSFIGTFIWKKELIIEGSILSLFIVAMCFIAYIRINKNLKDISDKISRLN